MGDADLIFATAVGFLECMGADAIPFLEERVEIAARWGDRFSEAAWRDVAEVASGLLCGELDLMYPCSSMTDPKKYHGESRRLRRDARATNDSELARQMLEIAGHYERLAASLEAMKKDRR
jgi:hypothetical protein